MSETIHLCDVWQHTIVKSFKHDPKSELGLMMKELVIFNTLENFNSLLNYTFDDFTPSGNLCYIDENVNILHQTPFHELFNQRWYIQHLIGESGDEFENPMSEEYWMKQTKRKLIKSVIHHNHSMTPEQLRKKLSSQLSKLAAMKNVIQTKGSKAKMNRNLLHLQKCQMKKF